MTTLTSNSEPIQTTASPPVVIPSGTLWNSRSIAIITLAWLILQFGGIFSPGLLDDVDSIYIEVAREMLQRHDFVTPCIDGVRFFDKPPLMYWMASSSMKLFGPSDWAARLPLALAVLALLLSVYFLGNRLFGGVADASGGREVAGDRGGFYSALALATAVGPYLYTRFFIPDILIALWMTLGIHLFLVALDRINEESRTGVPHLRDGLVLTAVGLREEHEPHSFQPPTLGNPHLVSETWEGSPPKSPLLSCLAFAAVLALNLLTKGLIGLLFPIAFVLLYLAFTRQLGLIPRFHLLSSIAVFLVIAAPWHILAALRNPAIALPQGVGLPAHGGWAWFYLYNEHIARFLSRRIPHDYGQTPVWLFWLYLGLWIMPWMTFLPAAIATHIAALRQRDAVTAREHEAALVLLLWPLLILGFFTLSARQEYYSLPAIPALALMAGGLLARADRIRVTAEPASEHRLRTSRTSSNRADANRSALRWSLFLLVPVTTATAGICAFFAITAPRPAPGVTLTSLLAANPALYNLSLGHLFDLTVPALGLFRGPLGAVALGLLAVGLGSTLLRVRNHTYAANLTIAAGMTVTLLAAHAGLVRFNPILGSKDLAQSINAVIQPGDLIVLDGELTTGSSILFYTRRPAHLIDGRVNGLWYGSFWPDAPQVFETEASLRTLWSSPRHVFLLTYSAASRQTSLAPFGPANILTTSGGKSVLINFAPPR